MTNYYEIELSVDNDPIRALMTEEERAAYVEARANGYSLLKAAHEMYMAAWARGKSNAMASVER